MGSGALGGDVLRDSLLLGGETAGGGGYVGKMGLL